MLMLEEGTFITRIKFAVTTSEILVGIRQHHRAVYHSPCQRLTVETKAPTVICKKINSKKINGIIELIVFW